MAYIKDGILHGSITTYTLSKKLNYHEVHDGNFLYSLHMKRDGEWLMQTMKVWKSPTGKSGMSLQGMEYDVSKKDPWKIEEIKPRVEGLVYPSSDDDIPF